MWRRRSAALQIQAVSGQLPAQIAAAARELPAGEREELCAPIAESLQAPLTVEEQAWVEVAERVALGFWVWCRHKRVLGVRAGLVV